MLAKPSEGRLGALLDARSPQRLAYRARGRNGNIRLHSHTFPTIPISWIVCASEGNNGRIAERHRHVRFDVPRAAGSFTDQDRSMALFQREREVLARADGAVADQYIDLTCFQMRPS